MMPNISTDVGSCIGHCGGASMGCFCDSNCSKVGDCCEDYALVCAKQSPKTSCQGRCGSSSKLRRISVRKGGDCNCDKYCSKVGDCCQDYNFLCQPSHSCKGRCKSKYLHKIRWQEKMSVIVIHTVMEQEIAAQITRRNAILFS
jgi:hypothetical protein